jgi:hypothetical protein
MIGRLTVRRPLRLRPELVVMRLGGGDVRLGPGMPGAPARRPAGGRADVGDRREQGVLPEVVGLPPGDLIKQVRFGPAVDGCRGQHRVLQLGVLPAAEGALGQEPLAWSLQGQRVGPAGPAPVQRVRGDAQEHLAGEGAVPRVQRRKLAHQLEDVSVAGETVEQHPAGGAPGPCWLARRRCPCVVAVGATTCYMHPAELTERWLLCYMHPAELTERWLLAHTGRWRGRLSPAELEAIATVRGALLRIARQDGDPGCPCVTVTVGEGPERKRPLAIPDRSLFSEGRLTYAAPSYFIPTE